MSASWLTYLIEHGAPLWLIAFGFISWVFKLNRVTLYKDLIRPVLAKWFDIRSDALRARLVNTLNDKAATSVIFGHYTAITRQLVTTSWHLSRDLKTGVRTKDRLVEAMKVALSDVMDKVRDSLSDYTHERSGKSLDIHITALTEKEKVEFYAPVVAEIIDVAEGKEGHDYQTLYDTVTGQVDAQIATATTMVILKETNERKRSKKSAGDNEGTGG